MASDQCARAWEAAYRDYGRIWELTARSPKGDSAAAPHAFRHLVATRLDQAGLSAREIADYLGHERISMTQDVYMSRQTTGVAAAAALDRLGPDESAG